MKEHTFFLEKKIHFIGIAGTGMIALAQYFISHGRCKVSGSDIRETPATKELENKGAIIYKNHAKENIYNSDLVIFSTAINENNKELTQAKKKKIPCISRGECLSQIMQHYDRQLVVAGTHGKTTSTGMLIHILDAAGIIPSFMIGGEIKPYGSNGRFSESSTFICESDESDGSFLKLLPNASILTNIEEEHLDYHKNKKQLLQAFETFIHTSLSNNGLLIYNIDDPDSDQLCTQYDTSISYGITNKSARFQAKNIYYGKTYSSFEIWKEKKKIGKIKTHTFGKHNIYNALGVTSLSLSLGIPFTAIKKGLTNFSGVKRRMQLIASHETIDIYDDYAHHPTEILTTLDGLKKAKEKPIICVFQPHRHSRVLAHFDDFLTSFIDADKVVLLPIYNANEDIDSTSLLNKLATGIQTKSKCDLHICYTNDEAVHYITKIINKNQSIITLGAGDVNQVAIKLEKLYKEKVPH